MAQFSAALGRVVLAFLSGLALVSCESSFAQSPSTVLEGHLAVSIADSIDGRSRIDHFLKSETRRKPFKLTFKGRAPEHLHTGDKIKVSGRERNASNFEVGSSSDVTVVEAATTGGVGGTRQVLVLRIQSTSAVSPVTHAQLASVLATADGWYLESSFGQLSIKNDLNSDQNPDVYTVQVNQSTAGLAESSAFSLCSSAESAVNTQFGVTPTAYQHVMCILPPDMNYSWYGTAYIGAPGSTTKLQMVINGNYAGRYPGGDVHEIGHNLGMHHSNTPGTEYGESSCVMGGNAGTGRRDFNGPHKIEMGWLTSSSVATGTYQLNAVEAQPSARQSPNSVLKVFDSVSNEYLYVSYRAPLGTFGPGLSNPSKTSIHRWFGTSSRTELIATLGDGQSFTRNSLTFRQVSSSSTGAAVEVSAQCIRGTPTVVVSPAKAFTSSLNTQRYTVTVTNTDVNCSDSPSFSLGFGAPTRGTWNSPFDSNTISIAQGQSATTSVSVTPSTDPADGDLAFRVSASEIAHTTAQGSGSYVLDRAAPTAPTTFTAAVNKRGGVSLSWSGATDATSGVVGYRVFRNGVQIATPTTTSFSDSPGSGTFTYTVRATDRVGLVSVESIPRSVSITTGTGGGKGGGRK